MDRKKCDQTMISISYHGIDALFMYTQLLQEALLNIADDDTKPIKELAEYCRLHSVAAEKTIQKIEKEYRDHSPAWWYSGPYFIYSMLNHVIDGRALRKRRQAASNTFGQNLNNLYSSGYNIIRDNLVPGISSTANQFSQNFDQYKQGFYQDVNQIGQNLDQYKQGFYQGVNQIGQNLDQYKQNLYQGASQFGQNWDQYKQNFNQGINQLTQGWDRFPQNFIPQYPYTNNNNNYANNQYGYNVPQNPNSMNYNYNFPSNTYQNYNARQDNPYAANNYYNSWSGQPAINAPYYSGNSGGQWYQNLNGQKRSNEGIPLNSVAYANQKPMSRRK
ncbi:unnamed protein product [Rotaria sordida]|uniref:Uncharacterized protein n=1 Tax=Rotaria sordida TaxID=392033 RepID=A0A819IJX1_9BILA|nr:unnamed protein product [Rotaria sordida]CAF4105567.1 unnamed protein product [Rotaria sordida]